MLPEAARRGGLTFARGLEAVEDVDPLDVVGEGGVGQQRAVPVDGVQGKLKGEFLGSRGATLDGLKYST